MRACGNMPCSNSSSFSEPVPRKYTYSLPQCTHVFGHGRGVAAVVADHFVLALVVGKGDGAVLAFQSFAAGAAQHHRRISAAIEQHHDLFFAVKAFFDLRGQLARDHLLVAGLLEFLPHVDDLDFRQRALLHAVGQLDQRVFIFLRVEIRFQRWRGRTQNHGGIRHLGAHHGNIAGVIARRLLLLVGGIMFFVDDDQREIGNRREDGRASADDHARVPALDAMPLLRALLVGERGVQDGNFIAEDLVQIGGDRWREADFRDEENGGAPSFEHGAHAREVNGGLARAGNAVQKDAGKLALVNRLAQSIQRGLLG